MSQHFIKRGSKTLGPFTAKKVVQLIKAKKLKSSDEVSLSEEGPWDRLSDVHKEIRNGTYALPTPVATPEKVPPNVRACPDCGGRVSTRASSCPHCGAPCEAIEDDDFSSPLVSEGYDTDYDAPPQRRKKTSKRRQLIENSKEMPAEELTPKQRKEIEKIVFAQDKYRDSFPLELSQSFKPQEFVLADTYGITEYYVLTTERLIICEISNTGIIFKKQKLGGPKTSVKLDRIVRLTEWSDIWWENDDSDNPAMMNLQIETLDGDYDLCVLWDSDKGYYQKDPLFFSENLHDAYVRIEEGETLREAVIYAEAKS